MKKNYTDQLPAKITVVTKKTEDGFGPNNLKKTFAELDNKNELSHRYKALKKFSKWYLHK